MHKQALPCGSLRSDVLLLTAVDMEDSGPYEIAEPRAITALETYTPSCKCHHWLVEVTRFTNGFVGLQTPRLKRLAEIVSHQAIAQQEKMEYDTNGDDINGDGINGNGLNGTHETIEGGIEA